MLPIEIIRKQKMRNALFTHGRASMDSLASDLLDASRQGVMMCGEQYKHDFLLYYCK